MEKGESRIKFPRRRAALEVRIGTSSTIRDSDIAWSKELYIPTADDWYLLTGHSFPDQTRYSGFDVMKHWSSWFLVLFLWSEAICLLICPASHTYVQYRMAEKKLAKLLPLKELAIQTFAVLVGRWNTQHGECGGRDSHSLCFLRRLREPYKPPQHEVQHHCT